MKSEKTLIQLLRRIKHKGVEVGRSRGWMRYIETQDRVVKEVKVKQKFGKN